MVFGSRAFCHYTTSLESATCWHSFKQLLNIILNYFYLPSPIDFRFYHTFFRFYYPLFILLGLVHLIVKRCHSRLCRMSYTDFCEWLIVWQAQVAQAQAASQAIAYQPGQAPPPYSTAPAHAGSALYPSLSDYMGLEITPDMISRHAVVPASSRQVCRRTRLLGLVCIDNIDWQSDMLLLTTMHNNN